MFKHKETKQKIESELTKSFDELPEKKTFVFVPISYYSILYSKDDIDSKKFVIKKLSLYQNTKRRIILLLLKLSLLPTITLKTPKDVDLIFFGGRIKLFDFKNMKIKTLEKDGDTYNDYLFRKKITKDVPMGQDLSFDKNILTEKLLWPTQEIDKNDFLYILNKMIHYYKKDMKYLEYEELIESRKERLPELNHIEPKKGIKILSSNVHGDFWKGNIEKYKDEIYVFDWGQHGTGTILEDVIRYFFIEYSYNKNIDKKKFIESMNLFKKEFNLTKDYIHTLIDTEIEFSKINTQKAQWNLLDCFKKSLYEAY